MTDTIAYTFRLPRDLKDRMAADAATHSRSINQHFVTILDQYLTGRLVPVEALENDPRVRAFADAIGQRAVDQFRERVRPILANAAQNKPPRSRRTTRGDPK
jgi:hypothetical protein